MIKDWIVGVVFYLMDEFGDVNVFICVFVCKVEEVGVVFEWNICVMGLMDCVGEIIGVYIEDEEIEVDVVVFVLGYVSWKLMILLGFYLFVWLVKGYFLIMDMSGFNECFGLLVVDDVMYVIVMLLGD